jgi:hypothetical protein
MRVARDRTTSLRLVLALAVGSAVALALPSLTITGQTAPSVALATLALAVASMVRVGTVVAVRPPARSSYAAVEHSEQPLHRPGRVTDPSHHPIRTRAPGLV